MTPTTSAQYSSGDTSVAGTEPGGRLIQCFGCGYGFDPDDRCHYCDRSDSVFAVGLLIFALLTVLAVIFA